MTRDPNQRPATAGQHAGRSDAERQEKITQLFLRRSKLSTDEAALLRQVASAGVFLRSDAQSSSSLTSSR